MYLLLITLMPFSGNYVATMTTLEFNTETACIEAKAKVESADKHYKAVCLKLGS